MKLLLYILGGFLTVIVLLLVAANIFVSSDNIRDRIAERIKMQTGRELIVDGDTSLTFLPNPEIVLTNATLKDSGADSTAIDLHMPRLQVNLDLWELISQRVDATYVLFESPLITIRPGAVEVPPQRKTELEPNTDSREPGKQPIRRAAVHEPGKVRFAKAAMADLTDDDPSDIRLRQMEIQDGTVQIYDERGQISRDIRHINAELAMPHVNEPLTASGNLELRKKKLNFDATLTSVGALRAEQPANVVLNLSSNIFQAKFDGRLVPTPEVAAEGLFQGTSSSFKDLIAWTPDGGQPAKPVIPGDIKSQVQWSFAGANLSDLAFALGETQGRGRAALHLDTPKPRLRAALAIETLNLTPFLPQDDAAPKRQAREPIAQDAARTQTPNGNDDWFKNPGPNDFPVSPSQEDPAADMQPGATKPKEPAPLDADINVNVRKTVVSKIVIGPSALAFAYHDGILTANLGGMQLYGGEGRGKLVIDPNGAVPVFSAKLNLDRVQAKPFLAAAGGFNRLSGNIKLILNLNGKGQEAKTIKSSLTGNGNVLVSDGALEGIDIGGILTKVGQGQLPKLQGGKTPFNSFGGNFTVRRGLAETKNFQLLSPLVKVSAKGTVNIPTSSMNILANPELVKAPEGMGDARKFVGITVPIRIQGPFDNPTFRPEVAGLFDSPESTSKTINQIGDAIQKNFKDKPVGEALGRFLGGVQIQGQQK